MPQSPGRPAGYRHPADLDPVMDVYDAPDPWFVPDNLLGSFADRLHDFLTDPRQHQLGGGDASPYFTVEAAGLGSVVKSCLRLLFGCRLVAGDGMHRLWQTTNEIVVAHPPEPNRGAVAVWIFGQRDALPQAILRRSNGSTEQRSVAWDLIADALGLFDGFVPVDRRLTALRRWLDLRRNDPRQHEQDLTLDRDELDAHWQRSYTDDLLSEIAMLAPQIAYLTWTWTGLTDVERELLSVDVPAPSAVSTVRHLLDELGLSLPPELHRVLSAEEAVEADTGSVDRSAFQRRVEQFKEAAIRAGQLRPLRRWLQLATSLESILGALPGDVYVGGPSLPVTYRPLLARWNAPDGAQGATTARMRELARHPAVARDGGAGDARPAHGDAVVTVVNTTGRTGGPSAMPAATAGEPPAWAVSPGRDAVIQQLSGIVERLTTAARDDQPAPACRLLFTGSSGTGRRSMAETLASALVDAGVLRNRHPMTITIDKTYSLRRLLTSSSEVQASLHGSLLLFRDVSRMVPESADQLNWLSQFLQDAGRELVVVLTCESDDVQRLFAAVPDLQHCLTQQIAFDDYSADDLVRMLVQRADGAGIALEDQARQALPALVQRSRSTPGLENGWLVEHLWSRCADRRAARLARTGAAGDDVMRLADLGQDVASTPAPVDPLHELDTLIGLSEVKAQLHRLVINQRANSVRARAGLPVIDTSKHMVFVGNPGTAKTTVARLVGAILAQAGVLSTGHLVEVTRGDLVASYVGHTAHMTRTAVGRAIGGVLFVDEAYSLAEDTSGAGDFGGEAIEELIVMMEEHRDNLVVICAGYPGPMDAFLTSNPGLASRMPLRLTFDDYDADELMAIFDQMAARAGLTLTGPARSTLRRVVETVRHSDTFGNGRWVRNEFEASVGRQAERIIRADLTDRDQLSLLQNDDIALLDGPAAQPIGFRYAPAGTTADPHI